MQFQSRRVGTGHGGWRYAEGVWEKGQSDGILSSIKNLMKNTGWPIEQAMTALKVPETDWPKYQELLGGQE